MTEVYGKQESYDIHQLTHLGNLQNTKHWFATALYRLGDTPKDCLVGPVVVCVTTVHEVPCRVKKCYLLGF